MANFGQVCPKVCPIFAKSRGFSSKKTFFEGALNMASLVRRGKVYYVHFYVNGWEKRVSLQTESFQIAKEKVRQIESSLAQGEDCPLPSRTPLTQVLSAYVKHIRTIKTAKSAQTDVYYLRQIFLGQSARNWRLPAGK